MPQITAVSVTDFPNKVKQSDLKEFSRQAFSGAFDDIEKILESFDNALIDYRNLSVPVDYFKSESTFRERNELYTDLVLEYAEKAISNCLSKTNFRKEDITDIIFVSSTGIATPSPDALIVNKMKLNPYIKRIPVWGLGCAGGVSGTAKAATIAEANPEAVVLLIAAELCSLTFIKNDFSKSNLIATGLFSDGLSAVLITGDKIKTDSITEIKILDSQSRLYYDSLDVMGWELVEPGLKVVFSKDIPSIVSESVKDDVSVFLEKNNLGIKDIKNFIIHPGGRKVIEAYINALDLNPDLFNNTKDVLRNYGNMSSATVLYVLNEFFQNGFKNGYGLMMSLGPGFSSEMLLLKIRNKN